ncbi:MAG: hypothetical protein P8R42_18185 [Candidatus Binatia bacterium]|nr:hypothetical protein [Candidatus Binatia bacterium]
MPETNVPPVLSEERPANAQLPLERAFSLPPQAYTSHALFDRETERVLRPEWLCIGPAEQVASR